MAHAGRGRWQSAHDNNQGLKTKGDPLAHPCGHGQQYRAACRRSLHVLALSGPRIYIYKVDESAGKFK